MLGRLFALEVAVGSELDGLVCLLNLDRAQFTVNLYALCY